jgi:hypothetical protein
MEFADQDYPLDQILYVDVEFPVGKSTRVRLIFIDSSKRDFLGENADSIRQSKKLRIKPFSRLGRLGRASNWLEASACCCNNFRCRQGHNGWASLLVARAVD